MNVIEKLLVMITSDTSGVKKGTEEARKDTQKLQDDLNNLNKGTDKVGESFVSLAKKAAAFFGVAAAVYKILGGIKAANDYAFELNQASVRLGVNAEALDAWGGAVKCTGGTAEGFQQSLKALANHFGTTGAIALRW